MRSCSSLRKHRRRLRFNRHYLHIRILLLEITPHTRDCSACADARRKYVNLTARLLPDLRACREIVLLGVCRIDELSEDHCSGYRLPELLGFCDRALHSLRAFSQLQFCAVCLQKLASLNAHRLGQGEDGLVSPCGRDCRQPYTGIAAGRFDDCRSFLQDTLLLRVTDHAPCYSVLDRTRRIQILKLHKQFSAGNSGSRAVPGRAKQRGSTDKFQCRFLYIRHIILHSAAFGRQYAQPQRALFTHHNDVGLKASFSPGHGLLSFVHLDLLSPMRSASVTWST